MDYKQKYEEALERAREYWETDNDNTLDIKAKGTMEYLFPELAESEDDEEIVKLADEYYDKVLLKECDMEEKEAHHCRIAYIHGAKAMLERQNWKPSEEQMIALDESAGIVGMFTQRGFHLTSLYNDLKKLNQQKSK